MPPDPIFPVAASLITQDLEPPEKRVAMVAAAALIEGPLAIAPALLALQRARDQGEVESGSGGGKPQVHRRLVSVPDVVGLTLDGAEGAVAKLEQRKLRPDIVRYESDEADKDRVQGQDPPEDMRVEQDSKVTLQVGAGPAEDSEDEAPADSIERTNQLLEHMDKTLTALDAKLAGSASSPSASPAQTPTEL